MWNRFSRTVLALVAVLFVHFVLVTYFTGNLKAPEVRSDSYDSLGQHLLRLEADVDPDTLGFEGFEIDGKTYMYFGPLPAMLRILPNLLFGGMYGQWARISSLLASALSLLAFGLLVTQALEANPTLERGARDTIRALAILAFGLGTPLAYLISCGRIYHEAVLWGLCCAMWGLVALKLLLHQPERENLALALLATAAGAALLARLTFALPFVLLVPFLVLRRPAVRIGKRLLLCTPLLAAAVFQMWYNFARFGSIWQLIDYRYFYIKPEEVGGAFNLIRIPTGLWSYFGAGLSYFSGNAPFIHMQVPDYFDDSLYFDWKEYVIPLTLASSWLVLGGLIGLVRLSLRKGDGLEKLCAAAFLVQGGLMLSYLLITQRFAAEFLPLLVFGLWYVLRGSAKAHRPWLRNAIVLILCMTSVGVTLTSTIEWNMRYNGDVPEEYKDFLRSSIAPDVVLPAWGGGKIYLSDLEPVGEFAEFAPYQKDLDFDGRPLRMLSKTYTRGLGVHAASKLRYRVPDGAVRFQAIIGLIDEVHGNWEASVEFRLLDQDGRILLDAGYFNNRRYPEAIEVDLGGATEITLEVGNAGNGWWFDQAAWVEAAFLIP